VLIIQLEANDPNECGTLIYSIFTNIPSNYEFDSSTGLLIWNTTHEDAGTYYMEFGVTDGYSWDYENISITVNEIPATDFEILEEDISFSDDNPLLNTSITITAFFRNLLDEDPESVLVRFYSGEPSNETYIGEDLIQIDDRSTFFAQTDWIPEVDGNYGIHVWIDPNDEIIEDSETNNMASKFLNVRTHADLRVREEDIGFSNNNPISGEEIQIFTMIRNTHNEPANNFTVRFYDNTGLYISLIGEVTMSIGGQQTEIAMIDWTASPHGLHNIRVVVDYYNIIEEWDKTNNVATKILNVLHPHPSHLPEVIIQGGDLPP